MAGGTRVKCWAREYDFGALLPRQIISQGEPLLAAPMRLRSGKALAAGTTRILTKKPGLVKLTSDGTLGPVRVFVKTQVEFDGYVWFDLTLSPGKEGKATLDSLIFEMPFRPGASTLFYSGSYTGKDTGAIPSDGYRGAWRHRFWVGDEEAGIEWFAESQRGWNMKNEKEALVIKDGIVSLSLSDGPLTLTQPLEISFGIMATPVRPRRPDWRSFRFGRDEINRKGWQEVSLWNTHWGTRWNYPILKPETAGRLKANYAEGLLPCLYCNVTGFSPETPEYRYWQEEWRKAPSGRVDFTTLKKGDENAFAAVCPTSSYTDFFVWALERAIRQADIRGLYFDVSDAPSCKNESHGCGWRDEKGKLHETVAIRATREFQKRVYTVAKKYRKDFLITIHMSGNILMPQHSFCEVMIDGENFTSVLRRQWAAKKRGDYFEFITLDKMRAEFMLHNFGPISAFLPEFARSLGDHWWTDAPDVMRATKHLVGLFALHDAPLWQAYMPGSVLKRVWYAQSRFGWDEKVQFIPYWKSLAVVRLRPENPNFVASVFRRPGSFMIVAMNNTDKAIDGQLSWNIEKLGLKGKNYVRIEDFYTDAWWRIKEGKLPPVPFPPRSFRMLVPMERR